MATHSTFLAWRIPMDSRAWWTTVHGGPKELDMTERRSTHISSVQSLSCVHLFVTPWTAAHQASLPFTIFQSLLRFMSIVSVMPSNHLFVCYPLLWPSIFSSIGVFFNESALHIKWPKYWSFNFSISLSSEYSGLISFGIG